MPPLDGLDPDVNGRTIEAGAPARDRRLCIAVTQLAQPMPEESARIPHVGLVQGPLGEGGDSDRVSLISDGEPGAQREARRKGLK